jgi:hypothetical protein
MRFIHGLLALSLGLGGCAAGGGTDENFEQVLVPSLESIAPTEMALGDEVAVIGHNFPTRDVGKMVLHLDGVYLDSDDKSHDFTGDFLINVENKSVASFTLEEIYFAPNRDKLGSFSGRAKLISTGLGGDEQSSDEIDVDLRIKPSIRVDRMRASDKGCADRTEGTNANTPIELQFSAIGLGEASSSTPWKVKLGFIAPQVQVRYVVPAHYESWPIPTPIDGSTSTIAPNGVHSMSFTIDQGSSFQIDPGSIQQKVRIQPALTIADDVLDEVVIQRITTGPIESVGQDGQTGVEYANFQVEITAGDRTLRRTVRMSYWDEVTVSAWNGDEKLIKRFSPEATSGCVPGGVRGINLQYTEGQSVTKTRSVGYRWDSSAGSQLGLSAGFTFAQQLNASQNWNESFGVDVNESVSSESHSSQNISAEILPSFFGMSYRQLEQLEREVDIYYHNVCGSSGVIGQATLTNWNFGFDVAQAQECPPPSNLPPAEDNSND